MALRTVISCARLASSVSRAMLTRVLMEILFVSQPKLGRDLCVSTEDRTVICVFQPKFKGFSCLLTVIGCMCPNPHSARVLCVSTEGGTLICMSQPRFKRIFLRLNLIVRNVPRLCIPLTRSLSTLVDSRCCVSQLEFTRIFCVST